MPDGPELKQQLRSLSIPREQRPVATPARGGGGRTLFTSLLVVLVLALGGYVAWTRFGDRLTGTSSPVTAKAGGEIKLFKVTTQPAAETGPVLTATGKIVSDHRVEVATKVSGQVVALYFEQGDHVAAGQLLARIEQDNYRARRDEAAANLERERANRTFQEINFERIAALHEDRQASDIEFADARRSAEQARAAVAAAEATLEYTSKLLRDCEVAAPIAGVILERNVEVGDFVSAEGGRGAMANAQFAAIADMEKLRVEVDVSELDIGRLRTDMPCSIVPDANKERRYRGHVLWIDPGANYAKATVQVKVRVDNPDDYLRVEGAAQVQFLPVDTLAATASAPADNRLWIPLAACKLEGTSERATVFVADSGRWKATPVLLGRRSGANVEVLSGLVPGETVAADGVDRLRDGATVAH
jgi:HlyD family secretion protein